MNIAVMLNRTRPGSLVDAAISSSLVASTSFPSSSRTKTRICHRSFSCRRKA
ncbi:hypothetical protein [Brachybacterium sacelli]|uniref:hypothetical protein n=1 Tax=Brachybacterium sacelli TaxID=173364 RepID=UPI00360F3B03